MTVNIIAQSKIMYSTDKKKIQEFLNNDYCDYKGRAYIKSSNHMTLEVRYLIISKHIILDYSGFTLFRNCYDRSQDNGQSLTVALLETIVMSVPVTALS